jgi:hypothetical protein
MTAAEKLAPTPQEQLDATLQRLKEGSRAFVKLSIDERIRLCEAMRQGYRAVAEASVIAACRAKGIDPESPLAGEEWLGGPMVTIRNLRLLAQSLEDVKRHGAPLLDPSWISRLPDGRLAVQVFPNSKLEGMLLAGHQAHVHMEEGLTEQGLRERQASFYKKPHEGRLCVVLGAGNVNSIPPTDVVHKLFVEGTVCILKMNPVNEYLGPFVERAFAPAIERGFFAVVYGGADVGRHLVEHPLTDEVHITGSDRTHDLMVWGPPGPEREERMKKGAPLLQKEISSELGNITPVVVVPGPWSEADLDFQAANIAGMVANNASFNCNSAKLLTVPRDWEGRERLLSGIEKALGRCGPRQAYYPGAEDRWKQFTASRPGLRLLGEAKPGHLPWALIPDVDPKTASDAVFNQEPWCAVLSETRLPGDSPSTFLAEAVRFLNQNVWGTLAVTLVVHGKTLKDPVHGPAVEKAIRELRYGAVVLNTWAGAVFGLGTTPWGGHPSATLANIQSGRGFVHNTFMLEGIEKCVLRAPHRATPVHPWFPGHRTVHQLGRKLVDFEMEPSWLKIPGIAASAMRA